VAGLSDTSDSKLRNIVPGAFTPVLAKHTKNLSIVDVLSIGLTGFSEISRLGKQRPDADTERSRENWSYLDYGPREEPTGMSREGSSRQEFAAHCSLACHETAITLTTQAELYSVGDSWNIQVSQGTWATSSSRIVYR
jgi:hypothetical protein